MSRTPTNCLHVRGLPPRFSERELFDVFKKSRGFVDARVRKSKVKGPDDLPL